MGIQMVCTAVLANENVDALYVASDGDDGNAGTIEKPFRTIAVAAGKVMPGQSAATTPNAMPNRPLTRSKPQRSRLRAPRTASTILKIPSTKL